MKRELLSSVKYHREFLQNGNTNAIDDSLLKNHSPDGRDIILLQVGVKFERTMLKYVIGDVH